MESDRYLLECLIRFRELVKQYALFCEQHKGESWGDDWSDENPGIRLRHEINKLVIPVKIAFRDCGVPFAVPVYSHSRIVDIDLTTELPYLPEYDGFQGWHTIFDPLERVIGLYELRINTGMPFHESATAAPSEEWRLIQVIERSLRPSFSDPPRDELHIQDVLKGVLLAARFEYLTAHTIPFGSTTVRPDFYIPSEAIALEVKYLRERPAGRIVGEMCDDVVRYRAGGVRRTIFVVYDNGRLSDVAEFLRPFGEFEDVRVLVIKH